MTDDTSPLVGYSSNDFYYTNPEYCSKTDNEYKQYSPSDHNILTSTPEKDYVSGNTITIQNACSANNYYATRIRQLDNQSQTTSAKYNYSLIVYNRELLRSVNYLAGIAALGVYMYFNRSK
jgi:hypothetical protein